MGDRASLCCAAIGSGARCLRPSVPDGDYCWQHAGHAKTGAGSAGHVMVQLSPAAFAIVDRLVATGLYGESRRACVESLVLQTFATMFDPLASGCDPDDVLVCRYGDRAFVRLYAYACILTPWPAPTVERERACEPPAEAVAGLERLLAAAPIAEGTIPVHDLVAWAHVEPSMNDDGEPSLYDAQTVAGHAFDRALIYEATRPMHAAAPEAVVRARVVPIVGKDLARQDVPGHALVLVCGETTSIVCGLMPESQTGGDPMPVAWDEARGAVRIG